MYLPSMGSYSQQQGRENIAARIVLLTVILDVLGMFVLDITILAWDLRRMCVIHLLGLIFFDKSTRLGRAASFCDLVQMC